MKKLFIIFLILLSTLLTAQTTSWTLSANANGYATINASTGVVRLIADTPNAITVTTTVTTAQNSKIITSTKQIILDSCTSCFTSNKDGLTYCGVKLSNGQCWLDRNLGATRVAQSVSEVTPFYSVAESNSICPTNWRLPTDNEWIAMVQNFGMTLTKTSIRNWATVHQMFATTLKFPATSTSLEYPSFLGSLGACRVTIDDGNISDVNWISHTNTPAWGTYTSINLGVKTAIRCIKN